MIVAEKHRDSVHQKAQKLSGNAPPGSQAFLSNYQTALSKVVESLGEEEVEEAKEIAKDWNSRGPPTEFKKKWSSYLVPVTVSLLVCLQIGAHPFNPVCPRVL